MPPFVEPLPPPYRTAEEADADIERVANNFLDHIIDDLSEFEATYVARSHPELAAFIRHTMLTGEDGGSIDALENSAEYQLYYAEMSALGVEIITRVLRKLMPNALGHVQYRQQQRLRALIGAP